MLICKGYSRSGPSSPCCWRGAVAVVPTLLILGGRYDSLPLRSDIRASKGGPVHSNGACGAAANQLALMEAYRFLSLRRFADILQTQACYLCQQQHGTSPDSTSLAESVQREEIMETFSVGLSRTKLLVVLGIAICCWLLPLPASATPVLQTAAPPNGNFGDTAVAAVDAYPADAANGAGTNSLFLPLVQTDSEVKINAADNYGCNPVAKIYDFSGYLWSATNSCADPTVSINCSPGNVWKDANGDIHLKINYLAGNGWDCAELISLDTFSFGKFQWQILGQPDQLGSQAYLQLFGRPSTDSLNTDKVMISFVRPDGSSHTAGNYSVYRVSHPFPISWLPRPYSTYRFTWQSQSILFQSLTGFTDTNQGEWASWTFATSTPATRQLDIPQQPVHVHIRLYGQVVGPVEVVIHQFKYTP